jgi:hypothetical protein
MDGLIPANRHPQIFMGRIRIGLKCFARIALLVFRIRQGCLKGSDVLMSLNRTSEEVPGVSPRTLFTWDYPVEHAMENYQETGTSRQAPHSSIFCILFSVYTRVS